MKYCKTKILVILLLAVGISILALRLFANITVGNTPASRDDNIGIEPDGEAHWKTVEEMPQWMQTRLGAIRAAETPIKFYGKVVDSDGNPIKNASIELKVTSYASFPLGNSDVRGQAVTNTDGLFEISAASFERKKLYGTSLSIETISKDGYEFDFDKSPDNWYEFRSDRTSCHKPDKAKPIVFYMRKRGELTLILDYTTYARSFRTTNGIPKQYWVDFVADRVVPGERKADWERRRTPHWDMEVLMEPDPEGKFWAVTYKTFDEGAGVLRIPEQVYIVPEEGYQPELKEHFTIGERGETTYFCLVVKTRNPQIYAVMNLGVYVSATDCSQGYKIQVNPYGERNFEYKRDEIPWRLRKRLEKEAKEALSEGRLPEKPDLPKLIEEYRNKEE